MTAGEAPRGSPKPARWFCRIEGKKEVGPITDKDLRKLASSGELTKAAQVRLGTNGAWVPAGNVKGLFVAKPKTVDLAAETVIQQPDPCAESPMNETGSAPANVPYLEFARPIAATPASTQFANTSADSAGAESHKSPPPRSAYSPYTPGESAPQVTNPANAVGGTKYEKFLWVAVGGGCLLLLALFSGGVLWMLSGDETEVAKAAFLGELPSAAKTLVSESHDEAADEFADESVTVVGSSAIDPFEEPIAQQAMVWEHGEELPSEPTKEAERLLPQQAEAYVPQQTTATTEGVASSGASDPASESETRAVDIPIPVEEDIAMRPESVAMVAEEVPEPAVPEDQEHQEQLEASEAAKLINDIDADVQQRLQQIAERVALGKQMETNRAQYQQALAAIGIATNDLPKMQRQYRVLEDSAREAGARALTDRNFLQAQVSLEREMATMAQQIAQVTSVGNAAVRAKPGLEQQWIEQNKQLAGLQQREGKLHQELMAVLDTFGMQSKQYRAQLLTKAAAWDTSCVEAALIRGLVEVHDERPERAVDDFERVLANMDGVLKQSRRAKDSPGLRIVQTALAARGFALFKLGKEPEAISDLSKAVGANGLYTVPLVFRGMVEAERGRHDAALRDFEAARRLNDPNATREAARLLATSPTHASPTRALTLAKEACDVETSWMNQEVLGLAFAANGQNVLARETYREAATQSPVDQADRLLAAAASLTE